MKIITLFTLLLALSNASIIRRNWDIDQDPSSLSNTMDVVTTHFSLDVELDFDRHQIIGKQTLFLKTLRKGVTTIDLDVNSISVLSVTDVNSGAHLQFSIISPNPNIFGDQLQIYLTKPSINRDEIITICIDYITTEPIAASWLTPEQTDSKILPYMYTQCQSVSCRSVAPFQDTPSIKSTFDAKITVPDPMRSYLSGNFTGSVQHPTKANHTIYKFESTIPMASYLFTIVAGNLVEKQVGSPRTFVISEPTHIDYYALELDQIDLFLTTLENYTIPYAWGSYKIVIMPPSFPMGGMENPLLTFASPSIIVGDKSGVSVAVHEIAHSWSGNLVTCKDWSNLWLNEGFTMYLERTADAIMFGADYSMVDAVVGNDTVVDDMNDFGFSSNFTSLHPELEGVNPDDAFSNVPYEKGYQFLIFIEQTIGKDTLQAFLRAYFSEFAFQSVGFRDVQYFFDRFIQSSFSHREASTIIAQINWDQWVFQPGYPPVNLAFSTPTIPLIKQLAQQYLNLDGQSPEDYLEFESYSLNEKAVFLQYLYDNLDQVTVKVIRRLDADFKLTESTNKEISWRWFRVTVLANYKDNYDAIDTFLGSIGRIKMIKPIYQALNDAGDREIALALLKKYQNFYHPLAVQAVQRVLGIPVVE